MRDRRAHAAGQRQADAGTVAVVLALGDGSVAGRTAGACARRGLRRAARPRRQRGCCGRRREGVRARHARLGSGRVQVRSNELRMTGQCVADEYPMIDRRIQRAKHSGNSHGPSVPAAILWTGGSATRRHASTGPNGAMLVRCPFVPEGCHVPELRTLSTTRPSHARPSRVCSHGARRVPEYFVALRMVRYRFAGRRAQGRVVGDIGATHRTACSRTRWRRNCEPLGWMPWPGHDGPRRRHARRALHLGGRRHAGAGASDRASLGWTRARRCTPRGPRRHGWDTIRGVGHARGARAAGSRSRSTTSPMSKPSSSTCKSRALVWAGNEQPLQSARRVERETPRIRGFSMVRELAARDVIARRGSRP